MSFVKWTWNIAVLGAGAMGLILSFYGDVQPKPFFGVVIDPQTSSWIYGFMFGSGVAWIASKVNARPS